MKNFFIVFFIVCFISFGCSFQQGKSLTPLGGSVVEIKETTVGNLNGIRVGVGNIWEREYTLPNGQSQKGLTAQLFIDETRIVAGKGSILEIGGKGWEVIEVVKNDRLGIIKLKPLGINETP